MRCVLCLVVAAGVLASAGCGGGRAQEIDRAVQEFHERLDTGRLAEIYAESHDSFRKGMTEASFRKFVEDRVQRGKLEGVRQVRYTDESMAGVRLVSATYNNDFANGPGGEFFMWHGDGQSLRLASYSYTRKHYAD